MSAGACVAYLGLRFDVAEPEIKLLEQRRDPRQIAAKYAGLSTYWANFGGAIERYVLFVGTKVAILGPDDDRTNTLPAEYLADAIATTEERLRKGLFAGTVDLHLEWLENA